VEDFRWETVPNRGTHNRKGYVLFNGCASIRHHKLTSGGRVKRLSASAGRSAGAGFIVTTLIGREVHERFGAGVDEHCFRLHCQNT